MDTGLGGWAADNTDGLARPFAGAGVGLGALATDRQSTQMADAPVAFDTLQPFKIHADFAAEVTSDDVLAILNGVYDLGELLFRQVLRANARIDIGFGQDDLRVAGPYAVNVTEGNVDPLVGRNLYTNDTSHISIILYDVKLFPA
jgi:hypothetical protein